MRAQKLLLTFFTGLLTILNLIAGVIFYFLGLENGESTTAIFFLGCTGVFSVYFHIKTKELYPFHEFNEPLEELSKKYWALHICFGLVLVILGVSTIVMAIKNSVYYTSVAVMSILFLILGLWTLLDTYLLNKFIVSYKERLEIQEEIDDIGNSNI
ncbi:hypothetical protein [Kordia sp.]|uniref:hypothetical protein n=1 Tax=Kordia sp. TaxID=1965332 RepID=UPI003D27783E